ncbi:MAG: hypothetical protein WCY41_00480 [Candidatus Micrarchaeia archaeon]
MLRFKEVAKNVRNGVQEFFRVKTRKEDFNYLPMNSRLPLARVRAVNVSALVVGKKTFQRYAYGQ